MFAKSSFANRGEIACRVIATAQRWASRPLRSIPMRQGRAPCHAGRRGRAPGAAASRENYLLADKIIEACKQTGAQAVHPGYGFLSENRSFAKRCEDEGIAFIGPRHFSIAAMGDKDRLQEAGQRSQR